MTRVLITTPLLRSYGRAIVAGHRLVRQANVPVDWLILSEQPFPGYDYRNVLHANQEARRACLGGTYSHLLMLEDDIVPPPHALDRLLEVGADVTYGLYCWRRGGRQGGRHLWNAYAEIGEGGGVSWATHSPPTAAQYFREQRALAVDGVGFGCTLIRRDVLERVSFRLPDDVGAPGSASTDWMFALDCDAMNATQACHLGVVCGHIAMEPSPRVIWPELADDGQPSWRYDYFEVT
jgi:hypothetical protein